MKLKSLSSRILKCFVLFLLSIEHIDNNCDNDANKIKIQ